MEPCGRKSSIRLPSYGRIQPCGSMSKQGCGAGYGRSKAQQQLGPIGRDEGPRPRYAPNGRRQGEAAQLILWSGVMCGIAGMIDWRAATSAAALRSIGEAMIETVRHRGPDAGDVWVEAEGGVVLGQRRLAIIDLSPGGAQPMHSADRRYVITFNGEIYNYRDIRRELQAAGRSMRSESDTEVLLEASALWGVEAALERAIGMFAFALWDRKTRSLVLARDRLGIKPLYYAATPERVIFASQLKAFRGTPGWKPTIDDDAVVGYLRHAYIAQPRTIYREARKLTPGHILTLREAAAPAVKCFWDLRDIAIAGERRNDPAPDANEAVERLDALLRDAVALRMIADVPLGAFLSGGIDSSTVVALMQAQSSRPVKTFSIGFHESGYDEAQCAKQVAAHLGTDHTEFYVEPRHALDVIPRLADWFDEPFADSSQIPTYLVSELTRKHVTVALSGDGGDELFAGYNRYLWAGRLVRAAKVVRATMAVGLEGRVPLLDHRVVAYSWTLPLAFKVRGGRGKWLLRRVLDRYVPRTLVERPKMGFGVPIDAWLRGPLRGWAESLLAPARLASDGLVRVEPVRRAWQEHLEGSRNWQYPLWTVLMLQAWRARWA